LRQLISKVAVAKIKENKPAIVLHGTSLVILPDDYIKALAGNGALVVLPVCGCIASGCVWLDMQARRRRSCKERAARYAGLVILSAATVQKVRQY
jgi:hypothetical protein